MILCVCLSPALDVTYRVARLTVGGTNRVDAVGIRPGGKGVNVARVLATLGGRPRVLAPVGGDTGARFAAGLAALRVELEAVPTGPDTRRTVTVVEADGTATLLSEPAEIDCWPQLVERIAAAVQPADAVVISGALPRGAPPDATSTLVASIRRAGRPVVVDTSGAALADALSAHPDVVKPNAGELYELTGDDDPVRATRTLARDHEVVVVTSLGADGVVAATARRTWTARPAQALTGNPTGAGDALVAGLARGLAHGFATRLPELLTDGVALAAAAVLRPHAGEVDPADVAAQRAGVVVRELDPIGRSSP